MNIGEVRCMAQSHVGAGKPLVACWQLPDDPFRLADSASDFIFRVVDVMAAHVGGERYVAVGEVKGRCDRFTWVSELGYGKQCGWRRGFSSAVAARATATPQADLGRLDHPWGIPA